MLDAEDAKNRRLNLWDDMKLNLQPERGWSFSWLEAEMTDDGSLVELKLRL